MSRRFTTRTLGVFAALVLASCFGDTTGPGELRTGRVAIAPVFDVRAIRIVDVNRVRVRLVRGGGTTALDTIVDFPATDTILTLPLTVPVTGSQETFDLFLRLIDDPAGDTVFASGPTPVIAVTGGATPQPVSPTLFYTGTGANAVGVRFVAAPASVFFQDTVQFTAEAVDAANNVIPNTPILFSVSDTLRARVPFDDQGLVVAKQLRGNVAVRAELLPTSAAAPPAVTAPLVVQPVPSSIQVQSGNAQSGTVGAPLPLPVTARVRAADNLGVQGVVVTFTVTAGGGVVSASTDTTDANGDVAVIWTLGGTLGAQTLQATAAGVTGGVTTATATGLVGAPHRVAFTVQPPNASAFQPLTPAVEVTAQDSFGNTVPSFTSNVTVALLANPTGATLSGTTTVAAVAGVATFADLRLDTLGAGFTLLASAAGIQSDTSAAFAITGGVPAALVITQEPGNSLAGTAIAPAVTVEVRDVQNALVSSATSAVTVAIRPGTGAAGAALIGATTVNAVNGVATFTGLGVDSAGTGYELIVTSPALVPDTSAAFTVSVGAMAQLVITTAPPATVTAGSAFGLAATARDAVGNTVTGFTGPVTIGLVPGTGTAGAALGGTTTVNAVAGVATFSGLTLDSAGTGYLLEVQTAGVPPDTTAAIAVAAGPASVLVVTTEPPTTAPAGQSFGLVVVARDAVGNVATGFTGAVSAALVAGTGTAGAALTGTTSVGAAAGVATFTNLVVDSAGTGYRLGLTGAGLTPDTTIAFAITAGTASQLTFATQPPSSTLLQSPFVTTVTARDAQGNVVAGYTGAVTLAIATNPASGTLSGSTTVNAVAGVATFSGVSIDNVGTGYTLSATATGLGGAVSNPLDVVVPASVNAWINTAGGSWSNPANWSKGLVPTATDTVFIRQSGTYTVTVDQSVTLARLDVGAPLGTQTVSLPANTMTMTGDGAFAANTHFDVSGGTVAGAGTVDVFGALTWQGGSFSGGSGTTRVNPGATLAVSGSGAGRQLNGYTLELGGTGTWATTTAQMSSGSGGTLRVLAGGQLDVVGDFGVDYNQGGAQSRAVVHGILRRTTSANPVSFTMALDDSGTVDVQTGTLAFNNNGTSSGAFAVAAGATFQFGGGTHNLGPTSTVGGAGTIRVSGGTTNAGGAWALAGATQVAGGTLNYNAATGSTGTLDVTSGVLGGNGVLGVSGAMTWTGGSLSGGGGATRVQAGGTLAVSGSGAGRQLNGYTLELGGTGTWATTTAQMSSGSGGTLRVLAGGQLDVVGDFGVDYNQGGAQSRAVVHGILRRTTSANPVSFTMALDDSGTVDVQTGTLAFNNNGTSSGAFAVAAGATFQFGGGTHNLGPTSTVGGAGTIRASGGTTNALGGWAVTGTTEVAGGTLSFGGASGTTAAMVVSGGVMGGSGLMQVTGTLDWTGGNFQGGSGTTRALSGSSATIGGTAARTLNAYTLEIAGTGAWSGANGISSGSGAVLRILPTGVLDISADVSFAYNMGGAVSRIENQGTVNRITSTGSAVFTGPFDNAGPLNVQSGILALNSGGVHGGPVTVASGAVLSYAGGTVTLVDGLSATGAGDVRLDGATLAGLNPADTVTFARLVLNSGALNPGAGGVVEVTSLLDWAGAASLGGGGKTLVPSGGSLTLTGTANRTLNNHTLENGGTATWPTTFTISSGAGAVIRNLPTGTFTVTGDGVYQYNQGGALSVFENLGTFTRPSGGTFALHVDVQQSGTMNVTGGALGLTFQGTYAAPLAVTSPGSVVITAGTHTFANGSGATGSGIVTVTGATIATASAADTARFTTLSLLGTGSLGHTGVVEISTLLDWTSAFALNGPGGRTRVLPGAALTLSGTSTRTLSNHTLENGGTATWSGTFTLNSGAGAVLRNLFASSLTITGDPTFSYNLGGAVTVLDNLGHIAIGGAGTTTFDVTVQHAGSMNINSGALALTEGGTYSATFFVAPGSQVDLNGGTHTFANLTGNSGGGIVRLVSGTLTTPTASDTARFTNLVLAGGTMGHPGVVEAYASLDWSGAAALSGAGGRTRGMPGAVLGVSGTATRNLSNHTLEVGGTGLWSGANVVNSGSAAVMRVLAGATLNLTAAATFSYSLGGTVPLFDNLGTVNVNPGAAAFVMNVPIAGNGAWNVQTGVFDVQGGGTVTGPTTIAAGATLRPNAGTLTYSLASSISGAGTLNVNGGGMNAQGPVTIGTISVSNTGTLALGSSTIAVSGDFSTVASGRLLMPNPGVLDINGNASFGGGPGIQLSNGVIRIAGNFSQSGATNSFAPTGSHRTVFDGAAGQTVAFASPTGSFFNRLDIANTGGTVTLTTNAIVQDTLRLVGSTAVLASASPTRLRTNGHVSGSPSSTFTPFVWDKAALSFQDSGFVSPDTTVFLVAGDTVRFGSGFSTYQWNNLRIEDDTIFIVSASIATNQGGKGGDVQVSSFGSVLGGTLALRGVGPSLTVNGNFATRGPGVLKMDVATAQVTVTGSATFAGGPSVPTAGQLSVAGDFTQSASGTSTSFRPSGSHRTVLNGTGTQNVSFTNIGVAGSQNAFDVLHLPASGARNVVLQDSVAVNDTLLMEGGGTQTQLIGAGTSQALFANGAVVLTQLTASPRLAPPILVMAGAPTVPGISPGFGGLEPDTAVYTGGIINLPVGVGIHYNHLRIATACSLSTVTIAGDLHISSGTAQTVFSPTIQVGGKLRTTGTGLLFMQGGTVTVGDSAIFAGGSVTHSSGTLRLLSHFRSTSTYQAGAGHVTEFSGAGAKTIAMANAGFGPTQSRFGTLQLARSTAGSAQPVGVTLLSDINALSVADTSDGATDTILGGFALRTRNFALNNTRLDRVTLRADSGSSMSANVLRFVNMDPTRDQMTLVGSGPSFAFNAVDFQTAPNAGVYLLVANNTAAAAGFGLTFTSSTPLFTTMVGPPVLYQRLGNSPVINWNGQSLP